VSRLDDNTAFALAFSPDGRWLASSGFDMTVRVTEASTGKEVSRLVGQGTVSSVAFSPDGKWVATGGDDKTARVMEAATGRELVRHSLDGTVEAVAFAGGSAIVAAVQTSNTDVEVVRIVVDPAELIRNACSHLPRNLTRDEWKTYLPGEPYRATCPNLPPQPELKK
jgi:WD40 repeat protein